MSHLRYTQAEFDKLARIKRKPGESRATFNKRKQDKSPLLRRAVVSKGLRKPR